jgi:sugar phosphate isomerase/epimerase
MNGEKMKNTHMISFGMPTPMECKTYDDLIRFCKETGYDFIELNTNFPQYTLPALQRHDVLSRLEGEGIGYSFHLPEPLDLGSLQYELRDAALSMIASLTAAVKPGTRIVCHMNSGIGVTLPTEKVYIYDRYDHEYFDALEDVFGALDMVLADSGCSLCMENLGNFHLPFVSKGLEMLLSSEHIGLTWDFGHDTTAKLVDTPFFTDHVDKVWEIHLHDSKDGTDHRPLYSGTVDCEKALSLAADNKIPMVIEVKTLEGLRESYKALQERGYR